MKPANGAAFSAAVRAAGRQEPVQVIDWPEIGALAGRGPLFHPDPGLAPYAWQRATHGHGAWSLTGITHTLSSHWAMEAVVDLLAAPLQPWDAVICTSRAGQRVVAELLQQQADYLRDRFKAQQIILPQLPLIPLGIHTRDFQFTAAQRTAARTSVGADADTLVVLFAGRLSFHAKAHPLAMYQAIEQAAHTLPAGRRILLVEFGQFASEPGARAFAEAARLACPAVTVRHLDGRQPENRAIAWACADVFCSLADNFQETFGITPLEAMAAGLPVVVSDWDGYRDTVRDGSDGFRIPTLMPQPGLGGDLAWRHASGADNFDRYCGHTCALIAVDVGAAAQAFSRLFASAELRARMGAAGRQRAREAFDWATIIPRYESLWESQEELRKAQASERQPAGESVAGPHGSLPHLCRLCDADADAGDPAGAGRKRRQCQRATGCRIAQAGHGGLCRADPAERGRDPLGARPRRRRPATRGRAGAGHSRNAPGRRLPLTGLADQARCADGGGRIFWRRLRPSHFPEPLTRPTWTALSATILCFDWLRCSRGRPMAAASR